MEEIINLEQPMQKTSQDSCMNSLEKVGENVLADGSILGKFQTVDELKKAYNSLQAEFTKKSQKLSELLKRDNSSSETEKTLEVSSAMQSEKTLETSQNLKEVISQNGAMQTNINSSEMEEEPQFNLEQWKAGVEAFLKNNPGAKKFASEITSLLLSDKAIASSNNSLDLAYGKVLAKHYKSKEELLEDDSFVENYVLNNSKVKQKIINDYLKNIQKNKVPTVVSNHAGSFVGLTPQDKPKNLTEANKLLEKMLKQK